MSEHDEAAAGRSAHAASNPFTPKPDDVYTEDQPEMRHVKISTGPSITKLDLPPLKRPAFPGPPPSLKARSTSLPVKEWSGKVPVSNWDIQPDCMEKVPVDFPLERTHKEIHDCDPCTVATRISDVLHKLSIATEFDNDCAKAKCNTEDFVSFRITLFSGGEGGQPVVVEVQKRSGPARSFMQSCRAILAAAEGKTYEPKTRGPPAFSVSGMKCLKKSTIPVDHVKECLVSLERIVELLKNKRLDTNVLGMENLCSLSDGDKNSSEKTVVVAKAVLIGDGKLCLRDDISATLQRSTDYGTDDVNEDGGVDYVGQLRQLSLNVFDNCLKSASKEGFLEGALKEQEWFNEALMPVLVAEVEAAPDSPARAYLAVSCINTMSACSQHAKQQLMGLKCRETVSQAHAFGKSRHERLAAAAQKCLDSFDSTE